MVRLDAHVEEEQKRRLISLGGTLSYHIRRAIDEYLERKLSVSTTQHGNTNTRRQSNRE